MVILYNTNLYKSTNSLKIKENNVTMGAMKEFMNKSIKFLMLIITIGLISASITYSAKWHDYVGFSPHWSWILAGSFILFGTVCFDIGYGLQKKGNNNSWGFFTIWLLITVYSMSSTVAGQYNQLLQKEDDRSGQINVDRFNYNQNLEEIKRLEDSLVLETLTEDQKNIIIDGITQNIDSLQVEWDRIQEVLGGITDKEERFEWRNTSSDLEERSEEISGEIAALNIRRESILTGSLNSEQKTDINERIEFFVNENKILVEKSPEIILEENAVNQGNIFQYFSKVFGGKATPLMIQFWLSVFPSVFIDLISPISSALFFYGIPNVERKEEDEYKTGYDKGSSDAFNLIDNEIEQRLTAGA